MMINPDQEKRNDWENPNIIGQNKEPAPSQIH